MRFIEKLKSIGNERDSDERGSVRAVREAKREEERRKVATLRENEKRLNWADNNLTPFLESINKHVLRGEGDMSSSRPESSARSWSLGNHLLNTVGVSIDWDKSKDSLHRISVWRDWNTGKVKVGKTVTNIEDRDWKSNVENEIVEMLQDSSKTHQSRHVGYDLI